MKTKHPSKLSLYLAIIFCFVGQSFQTLCDATESLNKLKTNLDHDANIKTTCKKQILEYINGLDAKSKWAINMLNSGALPRPSMNILGSFDKCVDVTHLGKPDITGQYCLVSLLPSNNRTFFNILKPAEHAESATQLATCIPNQCMANDTENFYSLLGMKVAVNEDLCQTKGLGLVMTPTVIITIIIFSVIFFIIFLSTVYEMSYEGKETVFRNLSLRTNFHKLFYDERANQLPCLHGIRVLCLFGVMLVHDQHNQFYLPIANSWYIIKWSREIFGAFLLSLQHTMVETFFLLSGFLIGYTYMKLLEQNRQLVVWKYYLNRYLRLTPAFAVVILFYLSFFQYLGSGPFWPSLITQTQVAACSSRWWMALLYIQNFSSSTHSCISQSWYLTADMQLYLLSPILLYVIKKRPQCFLTICKIFLLASFLYTIFMVLYYKATLPTMTQNYQAGKVASYSDAYYWYNTSTGVNATPWLVGIALSYIVSTKQGKEVVISKIWVTILWLLSIAVCILGMVLNSIITTSSTDQHPTLQILQALFLIFGKLIWSLIAAWVIFACLFNYAGCLNSFLSMPIFQTISKLSYSMYLIHNVIIFTIVAQYRYPVMLENLKILSIWCTAAMMSFFFAVLLYLFVELPATVITDHFLKRKVSNKSITLVSYRLYTENNS